jgi:hypothetical protein
MTRFRAALTVIGLLSTVASAQSPRPAATHDSSHLFRGRVVAARGGDPLPRARVAIAAQGAAAHAVLAGDDGRFSIALARPSDLTLTITKAGYAAKRLRVSREDLLSKVHHVRLEVGAAVSGRVVHPSGRAVVGIEVAVRHAKDETGDGAPAHWVGETDDRGEYRVGGLAAGRYVVTAGRPAATLALAVKAGDDLSGVNLVVEAVPEKSDGEEQESNSTRVDHARGTAVLQGRVFGDFGEPLAGARIRLRRHGMNLRTTSADANGHYTLARIPEGRYTIQATNPGYVPLEYGQRRSAEAGRTLRLREHETLRAVEFMLPRGNAITGNIVDEHGEPVEGAVVRALQLRFVSDRVVAQRVPGVRERRSDDRGQYRLFGLLPGTYIVAASVDAAVSGAQSDKSHGYASSYYPGTADVGQAWPLHVEVERDVYGAHIVLAPSTAVRISGTVHDSYGDGLKGLVVLTTSRWSRGIATEPLTVPVNGSFVLNNVPPGDYILQVTSVSDSAEPTEFVAQHVRVTNADVYLSLRTSVGTRMGGRVFVVGGGPDQAPPFSIVPVPADSDRSPVAGHGARLLLEPNGFFTASGLHGPIRLVLSGGVPGWYLKSVTINGGDATDVPYDFGFARSRADARVVISPDGGTIRGRVIDEQSAGVSEYTVVVFAGDRSKRFAHSRYTKFARPAQDDSFEVTSLPPGDYRVAAVASLDVTDSAGDWQNPATLEKLSLEAHRVRVSERDVFDLTLRMVAPVATRH